MALMNHDQLAYRCSKVNTVNFSCTSTTAKEERYSKSHYWPSVRANKLCLIIL